MSMLSLQRFVNYTTNYLFINIKIIAMLNFSSAKIVSPLLFLFASFAVQSQNITARKPSLRDV